MSSAMLLGIFDWVGDFFKSLFDLIPKVVYLLYASLACVMDVLQLFFRKIAGLDVYYVDGESVTGDLVTNFIAGILGIKLDNNAQTYPALTTVFYAFIIFGVIVCFACTFIAIIKSHYNYDDKAAKGPMQYVYSAGKAIINMVAVPIIVVLGLYVSQALLTALDSITSTTSSDIISMYGSQTSLLQSVDTVRSATGKSTDTTYIYYDIFGFSARIAYGTNEDEVLEFWIADAKELVLIGSTTQTFSGSLFKVAAYNANRVRMGASTSELSGFGDDELFALGADDTDLAADMIDTAFANNLHLNDAMDLTYVLDSYDSRGVWVSMKYFTNFLTLKASAFSKFNVGLVWYYYDLWSFNFIVGFGAILVCLSIFINIILGLITRIFLCVALFLIAPPLFGLQPLDGGEAKKNWIKTFMKQVLMVYGAVLGMNIMFLILPYINEIDFFNITIADYFVQTLIIIVGLITIKSLISTISALIGAEDANKTGEGIKEEVGSTIGKATSMTMGAAKFAAKLTPAAIATKFGVKKLAGKFTGQNNLDRRQRELNRADSDYRRAQNELYRAQQSGDEEAIEQAQRNVEERRRTYDTARDARDAAQQYRDNRRQISANRGIAKVARKGLGIVKQGGNVFATGLTQDKGFKAFKDAVWKPPQYDKITAENTAAIQETQEEMQSQIRELSEGLEAGRAARRRERARRLEAEERAREEHRDWE